MDGKERQLNNKLHRNGPALNLNWNDKKVKTNNLLGCFEINQCSVHGSFLDLSRAYNMVQVIEGKIV